MTPLPVNRMIDQVRIQTVKRCVTVTTLSLMTLLIVDSPAPVHAGFFDKFVKMYSCVVTWGQICDLSEPVTGTGPPPQPIHLACARPWLNGHPDFLVWPPGTAKYHFMSTCTSPEKPGPSITVRWEGSWTPSETKTDRPNASESLEIVGYEPFLPDRSPGGRIYLFWTYRCIKDPWLDSGGCYPFGAYVPDDLREAFPDIHKTNSLQPKPGSSMRIPIPNLRALQAQYLKVNPIDRTKIDMQQSTAGRVSPPLTTAAMQMMESKTRASVLTRGVEPGEQASDDSSHHEKGGAERTSISIEMELLEATTSITFDQPLHVVSIKGEDQLMPPGVYEIEVVHEQFLSLSKEGQEAIFLPAQVRSHSEILSHPVALLIPDETHAARHLVFLTPAGQRYDAVGSTSSVRSRDVTGVVALPASRIKDAIAEASSAASLPPCKQNTLPYGPRWVPVPCAMPAGMPGGLPSPPVPYPDGNNMLHACVNNRTGAFRIVRSSDTCVFEEAKVKWQLTP